MTYPATTYAEGVELTITSGNQLHEIINGDATEEINTESGMVPSVRKALADSMLFKPAIAWAEGSVESDPFQTRLYGEGIYWAPAASNETPISMGTNPNIDGNWFLAPVTGGESISRNTNLLSNHNFILQSPDDITHPSITPTDYVAGTQVFSGVFVGDDIVGLTYIDGRVSWTSGTLYFSVPNSGALEYVDQTDFVASVADFDGKPRTRGVSFALVGDEYRVTVGIDALEDESANATPLGSVKFEQGSVATGHELSKGDRGVIYLSDYVTSAYPNDQSSEIQVAINKAMREKVTLIVNGKYRASSPLIGGSNLHVDSDFYGEIEYDYEQVIRDINDPDFESERYNSLFVFRAGLESHKNISFCNLNLTYIGTFNIAQNPYYVHGGGQLSSMQMEWCEGVNISNITASGWNYSGINFDTPEDVSGVDPRNSKKILINGCDFSNNRFSGLLLRHVENVDITGTNCNYCGFDDQAYYGSSGYGIASSQNYGNYPKDIRISGGNYSYNFRKGIDFHGGSRIVIGDLTAMWNMKSDIEIITSVSGVTNISNVITGGVADVETAQSMIISSILIGFSDQSNALIDTDLCKYNLNNIQVIDLNRQDLGIVNASVIRPITINTAANNIQVNINNLTVDNTGYIDTAINLTNIGTGQTDFSGNTLNMSNITINSSSINAGESSGLSKFISVKGMESVSASNIVMNGNLGQGSSYLNSNGWYGGIDVTDSLESHFLGFVGSDISIKGQGWDGTSYVDYEDAVFVPYNAAASKFNVSNTIKNGDSADSFRSGGINYSKTTNGGITDPQFVYGGDHPRTIRNVSEYKIKVQGNGEVDLLELDIPNDEVFLTVEVNVISSRAPYDFTNASQVAKSIFAIGRTVDSGSVVDELIGVGEYDVQTSNAGGNRGASPISLNAVVTGGATENQKLQIRGTISSYGAADCVGIADIKVLCTSGNVR